VRDQLATKRVKVEDEELVTIALNGFFASLKPFVQGIYAQEKLPIF
jgi:hypothetical protein